MEKLLERFSARFNRDELLLIKKAIEFERKAHAEQKRESGEPYSQHPEAVAEYLFDMGMDSSTVIAGLLHDTIEDCEGITFDVIKEQFSSDIAVMVNGVTKLTQSSNSHSITREDRQAENLRKMFMAIAKDVRIVIIKLADRLHNMRTLEYCDPIKRQRKAKETLDVYAPLAHRFGMGMITAELEDIAFEYLHPDECSQLKAQIAPIKLQLKSVMEEARAAITKTLAENNIKMELSGRPKHLYSIYKKVVRQNVTIDRIYDLIALRVIVDSKADCYTVLGLIHGIWRPFPGRLKDYIAMPKTNQYQSLHTTVFSQSGLPFEIQIRTWEMHKAAEYGIAAHWMYKESQSAIKPVNPEETLAWLKNALEYESFSDSTREFIDNVRRDFLSEFVFVLTPQGEIIDLLTGSTPIDFAYRIHTNVGNHAKQAKVNGSIVRLDYKLKNNDVVEIITSPSAAPSRDWLKFVKTQQAKGKIKTWFKRENRDENIVRGNELLDAAAKRNGCTLNELLTHDYIADVLRRFNMQTMDDVAAAVGYGGITTSQVLQKALEQIRHERRQRELEHKLNTIDGSHERAEYTIDHGVKVLGSSNMTIRLAQCCKPLPGDGILGYVTRGRGVSVHRLDCKNAPHLLSEPERIIPVEWAENPSTMRFPSTMRIIAKNREGLLMEIASLFASQNVDLTELNSSLDDKKQNMHATMTFTVAASTSIDYIKKSLLNIPGVYEVYRGT